MCVVRSVGNFCCTCAHPLFGKLPHLTKQNQRYYECSNTTLTDTTDTTLKHISKVMRKEILRNSLDSSMRKLNQNDCKNDENSIFHQ